MKAIIFGVTGQDGSHLADLLLSKDYDVVGVARRSSVDTTLRIKHLSDNSSFSLVHGDITDASSVINILRNNSDVNEVYNLAAQSHVARELLTVTSTVNYLLKNTKTKKQSFYLKALML